MGLRFGDRTGCSIEPLRPLHRPGSGLGHNFVADKTFRPHTISDSR